MGRDDDRTTGFLILAGATLAAGAGFVGRRQLGKRRQSAGELERTPEPAAVHTFERPVPADVSPSVMGSVAVANRPQARAATIVETLSPQARLAEQLEETEGDAEGETHQACEIACWRGYVT